MTAGSSYGRWASTSEPLPVARTALVTGVGRRQGIGVAVVRRLAAAGVRVVASGWPAYDGVLGGADGIVTLRSEGVDAAYVEIDLAEPDGPHRLVDAVPGHLDVLVVNHAHSAPDGLGALTAADLDRHLAVNVRATLLLVQAFAARHDGRPGGRVVLLTSGQGRGPMPEEIAYAASKAAIAGVVETLADAVADRGITVNAVNPGPTDTGWATAPAYDAIRAGFPAGRWGTPDDAAALIGWLCSPDAGWVTGQVIHAEGGFRRG